MIDQDLFLCFVDEAKDTLERFERTCLDLEASPSTEKFDELFRAAHNLKGTAWSVGQQDFGAFVHRVEDLISLLIKDVNKLEGGVVELLLEAHASLANWVEGLRTDPHYKPDIEDSISAISWFISAQETPTSSISRPGVNANEQAASAANATSEEEDLEALFWKVKAESEAKQSAGGDEVEVETIKNEAPKVPSPPASSPAIRAEETIRITASKLDQLIQLVGELSIHQAIIAESKKHNQLTARVAQHAIQLSEKITKDVYDKALALRMQPVRALFQRLERAARDVARGQKKLLVVNIEGSEVELDRNVIEQIGDPIIHMLRNAVDHGLESPEERMAVKKPAQGTIWLSAVQDASGVKLYIRDDGRGLNEQKIRKKAVEKGLIKESDVISQEDIWRLIFNPGFSTADQITDISGRGVGMDVVLKAITALRGKIDIESKLGQGSTFIISLPTSLSIMDALVVQVERVRYAVPMHELSEIVDLRNFVVETTGQGGKMISLRGSVVPVENLAGYLPVTQIDSLAGAETRHSGSPALIVECDGRMVAFSIDQILLQQQVVKRPLSGKLAEVPGLSGCTILGDGEPGMIVSLTDIARWYSAENKKHEVEHEQLC